MNNLDLNQIDEQHAVVNISVFGRTERVMIRKHGEPNAKTGAQSWMTVGLVFVAKTRTGRVLRPTYAFLVERDGRWNFSTRAVTLNRQTTIVDWNFEDDELENARQAARDAEAAQTETTDPVRDALAVMVTDSRIRGFLQDNDPQAFAQALDALGWAPEDVYLQATDDSDMDYLFGSHHGPSTARPTRDQLEPR